MAVRFGSAEANSANWERRHSAASTRRVTVILWGDYMYELFSSEMPDMKRLREALLSADGNVRAAAIRGVEKGGRRILAAQKAYAPEKLKSHITMETETLKDGTVRARCGYQKEQFSAGPPGWSYGLQGAVAEFGSPGHSTARRASQYYEVVINGKKRKKKKRGRVAQPHIRRGYDEQIEAAVQDALGEIDRAADVFG